MHAGVGVDVFNAKLHDPFAFFMSAVRTVASPAKTVEAARTRPEAAAEAEAAAAAKGGGGGGGAAACFGRFFRFGNSTRMLACRVPTAFQNQGTDICLSAIAKQCFAAPALQSAYGLRPFSSLRAWVVSRYPAQALARSLLPFNPSYPRSIWVPHSRCFRP